MKKTKDCGNCAYCSWGVSLDSDARCLCTHQGKEVFMPAPYSCEFYRSDTEQSANSEPAQYRVDLLVNVEGDDTSAAKVEEVFEYLEVNGISVKTVLNVDEV